MNKISTSYKTHNIAVDDDNYRTLKEFGRVGDSFNDVITSLIKIAIRRAEDRQDDKC